MKLKLVSEIVKSFIEGLNVSKCHDKLKNEINAEVSLVAVKNVYSAIRNVIFKYYNILYQSELLGEKDKHLVFSVDKIMFVADANNNQIWLIGPVDNISKD